MTKDSIITLPKASLRQRSQKIGLITDQVKKLVADMKAATIDWEQSRPHEVAVGLAAVQVDQLYRIFIIRQDFKDAGNHDFQVFINPKIAKRFGDKQVDAEGCLSVPEVYGMINRYEGVKIDALDESGKPFRVTAKGYLARILQHELDHLNGITIVDHIKDQPEAFYQLDETGQLEKLDYEKDVKNSSVLW